MYGFIHIQATGNRRITFNSETGIWLFCFRRTADLFSFCIMGAYPRLVIPGGFNRGRKPAIRMDDFFIVFEKSSYRFKTTASAFFPGAVYSDRPGSNHQAFTPNGIHCSLCQQAGLRFQAHCHRIPPPYFTRHRHIIYSCLFLHLPPGTGAQGS